MANFAVIGVAGYIAPRHLEAIKATGNHVIAALDPHDSVGILDRYFSDAHFFTEPERFDRHLEKLRRGDPAGAAHYVTICSPNYLHDAHIRMALRLHAHAVCEKPLVINPWNLDALADLEREYDRRVYTVLQLRLNPRLIALREQLMHEPPGTVHQVDLSYITRRGRWYNVSWKGDAAKSGGVAMNIGVHFYDLLVWLFGPVKGDALYLREENRMVGRLELERAHVRWFLSVEADDLPAGWLESGKHAFRSLTLDGDALELSENFGDLHTRVYSEILAGRGFGIEHARPAIELVHRVRHSLVSQPDREGVHPAALRFFPQFTTQFTTQFTHGNTATQFTPQFTPGSAPGSSAPGSAPGSTAPGSTMPGTAPGVPSDRDTQETR
jgi:UDP-N-acetyl-2-amino-2-deoxyglucuronate dehydrogenase